MIPNRPSFSANPISFFRQSDKMKNSIRKTISALTAALAIIPLFFCACDDSPTSTITIWTDKAEIASYAELFNASHDKTKAVVVYKERLSASLPPAKDEAAPDAIIGSLLKNSGNEKYFANLDDMLGERDDDGEISKRKIDRKFFYSSLLDYGKNEDGKQILIPVSFNLPVIIFSDENKPLVKNAHMLELEEIRDLSKEFNATAKSGIYTKMGFAPSWNSDFLYTAAKMTGADFHEEGNALAWDEKSLEIAEEFLREWTKNANSSSTAEQDFSFKYLYTPNYKQVASGRCLFAYTTTSKFFSLAPEQTENLHFRWLTTNKTILADDEITTAGIYRKSPARNRRDAKTFLLWMMDEENQRAMLDRSFRMNLGTKTFGICGGFSALKGVNERFFPTFYKNLLGNLPGESAIRAPAPLPTRWESLKERVVIPHLAESTRTEGWQDAKSIDERLKSWAKQFN